MKEEISFRDQNFIIIIIFVEPAAIYLFWT